VKTLRSTVQGTVRRYPATHSVLFGFFACLALGGCGGTTSLPGQRPDGTASGSDKPKASADTSPAGKDLGSEKPKKAPDFSLSAEELEAEYQMDKQAAEKKYKGKIIELSGVVERLYGDEPAFIGLHAGKRRLGLPCVMTDKEPWARVARGQTVKLRGSWATQGDLPALYDCMIVDAGPNSAVLLSAAKLAEEYAADPKSVANRYNDKAVILSGEVVENKNDESGRIVRLKGTEKVSIELRYGPVFEKRGTNIMAGEVIKVYGEFTEFNFSKDLISLTNPYPITK